MFGFTKRDRKGGVQGINLDLKPIFCQKISIQAQIISVRPLRTLIICAFLFVHSSCTLAY
jgi:hypothetical protein